MENTIEINIRLPFAQMDDSDDPVSDLVQWAFKAMGRSVNGADYCDIRVDGVRYFLEPNADLDEWHSDFYGPYGADGEDVTLTYRKAI